MTYLVIAEWLGVATALIYVYLASRGNRFCFVFGLISSVLFALICFNDRLYFDALINTYYIIMSFVGWFAWGGNKNELGITKLKNSHFYFLLLLSIIIALILGYLTTNYTDASLPFIDSTTTVLAVLATWMLVKKATQNWIVWIIADSISIFLYVLKDHYPIALLFLVYTVISVYGYSQWKAKLKLT